MAADNLALIKRSSPSIHRLITDGHFDNEFLIGLNRVIEAAREEFPI